MNRSAVALLVLAVTALLTVVPASAQDESSTAPPLTLLVHHPHPDDADPFGFPFPDGSPVGVFAWRFGYLDLDRDGFDFPSLVADGRLLVEGLPDPNTPYASTLAEYRDVYDARAEEETPFTLRLDSTRGSGGLRVDVEVTSAASLAGESVHLWLALAEDPVHYVPPAALSNGVYDHRFTTRAVERIGQLEVAGPWNATHTFTLDGAWDPDKLVVAAWLQQGAVAGNIFSAHEVVQATHAAAGEAVVQTDKGVLMELYSATWCDPCLFGDRAAEDLAISLGAAEPVELAEKGTRYLETPARPWLVAPAIALGAWLLGRRWRHLP